MQLYTSLMIHVQLPNQNGWMIGQKPVTELARVMTACHISRSITNHCSQERYIRILSCWAVTSPVPVPGHRLIILLPLLNVQIFCHCRPRTLFCPALSSATIIQATTELVLQIT